MIAWWLVTRNEAEGQKGRGRGWIIPDFLSSNPSVIAKAVQNRSRRLCQLVIGELNRMRSGRRNIKHILPPVFCLDRGGIAVLLPILALSSPLNNPGLTMTARAFGRNCEHFVLVVRQL
jgi:hypothetical protein